MSLFERIIELDKSIFFSINHGWACTFLDYFMVIITNNFNAIFLIAALIILAIFGGKKGRIVAIFVLLAVGVNDLTCGKFLKPLIGRLRPCRAMDDVRTLVRCSKSFSMPSNHSSNIFTFAISLGLNYKKALWGLIPLAIAVALSRAYVGVHYPSDIITGTLIGIGIGTAFAYFAKRFYIPKEININNNKGNSDEQD